jgi:cell division protein FtsB
MFETLTGLQRELIEQQETNAQLKQKIEELEAEVCTCKIS